MSLLVIYNPKPCKTRSQVMQKLKSAIKLSKQQSNWFSTERELAHTQLKFKAQVELFDSVVVVGGDGTLHQAVNLLADFKGKVGYVPAGTGNDFGRHWLGKLSSIDDYITIALNGDAELCDVCMVNDRRFINSVGVGFDGALIKRIQAKKSWLPILTYITSALRELIRYRSTSFEAQSNENFIEQNRCLMFVVANAPYYGAGMRIAPHADPQDGFLSYTCVEDRPLFTKMLAFVDIFKGTHVRKSFVTTGQFKSLDIISKDLPMHADGEYIGETPAQLAVCPEGLYIRKTLRHGAA